MFLTARLGGHENNEFRIRVIDIDGFEAPLNRYGEVPLPRALQPQQQCSLAATHMLGFVGAAGWAMC